LEFDRKEVVAGVGVVAVVIAVVVVVDAAVGVIVVNVACAVQGQKRRNGFLRGQGTNTSSAR